MFTRHRSKDSYAFILIVVIFLIKLLVILKMGNNDWEPDSYQHFLQLKTVFVNFPDNLKIGLEVWTKPLFAFPLGLITFLFKLQSFYIIKIINLFFFSLISYLSYKIVLKITQNLYAGILSVLLISFSLWSFTSSISALTESIFTLALVSGFYCVLSRKYNLASLFFGLSILGRIEGFYFAGIYGLWLLIKFRKINLRLFKNALIIVFPAFIWNLLGYIIYSKPLYLFSNGYPPTGADYGYGNTLFFPIRFISQESVVTLLFLIGLFYVLKSKFKSELILASVFVVGFVFLQIIFWNEGMFGSAGLTRYMISIIPFMVIIGTLGISKFIKSTRTIGLVTLVQLILLFIQLIGMKPIDSKWIKVDTSFQTAGIWIKDNYSKDIMLYADRPEVAYYAERDLTNFQNLSFQNYIDGEKGIYVWSKNWGLSVYGISLEQMELFSLPVYQVNDEVYVFVN